MNMKDDIGDVLYDRQEYKASGEEFEFFTTPIGQRGKEYRDTNMYLQAQLPRGNSFLVDGIELIFLPALGLKKAQRIADINAVARAGVVQMNVGHRTYMQTAPLASCPAAKPWHGEKRERSAMNSQLSEQFRDTDYGAFGGRPFPLIPIWLAELQTFTVRVFSVAPLPSGKNGVLWCRLPGVRRRDIV